MFIEIGGKIINTDKIQMVEKGKAFGSEYTRITLTDFVTEVNTPYAEVRHILFTENWKRANEK